MEEDPVQSSSEPAEASRVEDTSLADEITSQLDNMFRGSAENKPKPIRPPKPSSIKEFDSHPKRPEGEANEETEGEKKVKLRHSKSHSFQRKRDSL